MSKILSSEIVSLVHHVKLNENGWWEKVVQNIIISAFGMNENLPIEEKDLLNKISLDLNIDFDKNRISRQFEVLKGKKIILTSPDGLNALSEDAYNEFISYFSIQKEIEFEAEKRFNDLCNLLCAGIEPKKLWKELNELLIVPLIREIGAKTYELISGEEAPSIEKYGQFTTFISRFREDKLRIQNLLLNYFDFKNENVRKYVLHQLNAYFFIEATNLDQKTVEQVYTYSKSQKNIKIFLDTNFLLTLLDLHDNPSNDASFSLLQLLDEIKKRVIVKLYVLPITVEEFQNLIKKFRDFLKKLNPTLNQIIAAESSDEFSGVIKKYFQKCVEQKSVLDIDDYFDPYLNNFTVFLRKNRLEIEQAKMEKYSTDQRVIDDLLEQVDYRFERNLSLRKYNGLSDFEIGEQKEIIYSKFNHDCQIWYYLKDKRPAYIDSTKDVENWILTLDFSFLEFDKYKLIRDNNLKVSLCLHPNELISMLQFWVPRTEKFENAILGNFKLPFLFKEVDSESEKVSIEILKAMSQYEDRNKFSSEFVTELLTNKALRQKIKVNNSIEENAILIKEELFKKYEESKKQLTEEKKAKIILSEELNTVKTELTSLHKKIDIFQESTTKKIVRELDLLRQNRIKELKGEKEKIKITIESLKNRINDTEEQIQRADLELSMRLNSFSAIVKSLFLGKELTENELRIKIHNKYYDAERYRNLKNELERTFQQYDQFSIPQVEGKIIIYCENQNALYFNKLKFDNIHFISEKDSSGVFIKTIANPTHFGLRDRDFLSDSEINKIKKEYVNYKILEYYCFENYLFHPENLSEILLDDFDSFWYKNELIKQKNKKYDKIVMNLKNARNTFQEFKLPDNKFRENDEVICNYLKSDDLEIFLKSFSLKTEFDKSIISKHQLPIERLISTDWFRKKIEQILTF